MFEKKITNTVKVQLKNLTIENGSIVDIDGVEKDLNKIVALSFNDGDYFDFVLTSKSDDSTVVEEEDENDE